MTSTDEIPTDLADAVRHAAAVVPAGRHSLTEVHRRRRLHQRRRTAAVAGVATVAVAVGAVGVPLLVNSADAPAPGPAASATASPAAAGAQRLLLGDVFLTMERPGGTVGITGPAGILEVDAAGKVIGHPVAGVDSADRVIALPDGRMVVLGPRDLRPGVRREDGPDVTDLELRLVFGGYNENVRVQGEDVQLIGATAEGAYLLRAGRRLVFHEFATGTERPLDAATAAFAAAGDLADRFPVVQNNYLVFATRRAFRQEIHIVGLTTGTDVVPPVTLDEGAALALDRLSPDGRTLALVTLTGPLFRLTTVDLATGRVLRHQDLPAPAPWSKTDVVGGIAFSDNHTVRVAHYALPVDRMYQLSELLKVTTFGV